MNIVKTILKYLVAPIAVIMTIIALIQKYLDSKVNKKMREAHVADAILDAEGKELAKKADKEQAKADKANKDREELDVKEDWHTND